MAEKKNGESSADEILDQLADELGVSDDEPSGSSAAEVSEDTPTAEREAVVDEHSETVEKPARSAAKAKKAAPRKHIPTNEEAIGRLFGADGKETVPGDPRDSPVYEPELDEPAPKSSSVVTFAITAAVLGVLIGVGYVMLPAEYKDDLGKLLSGVDIIEVREQRAIAQAELARAEQLAAMPKYGTIEIVTDPNNMLVTSEGHAAMIFPGSRTDVTYPTRSRVVFQNISVTEPFTFTIQGEGNFEDKVVTIAPFGDLESTWEQSYSGNYTTTLTYMACWPGETPRVIPANCLTPATDHEWRARELQWRREWRPDPEPEDENAPTRLLGSITITSEPPGAFIAFNGRQLYNEETGTPYVTPHTFNTYNAPADRVNAETQEPDRTPDEVYLSREGLPLTLLLEGKARATMGLYSHQFVCNPVEGQTAPAALAPDAPPETPEPDFLGFCNYTFSANMQLLDPPEPEGSGEGSGAGSGEGSGAAAAPAAAEGSGAAGE